MRLSNIWKYGFTTLDIDGVKYIKAPMYELKAGTIRCDQCALHDSHPECSKNGKPLKEAYSKATFIRTETLDQMNIRCADILGPTTVLKRVISMNILSWKKLCKR